MQSTFWFLLVVDFQLNWLNLMKGLFILLKTNSAEGLSFKEIIFFKD